MKIIADLSYPIYSGMPAFPGDGEAKINRVREFERDAYTLTRLDVTMHVGTHIDMPSHLTADTRSVLDFDVSCFAAPAVTLDCRGCSEIALLPKYAELIRPGDAVLICTDFADLYAEPERFYSDYPVLTDEFAEFLCERRISMLGLDTPSPDKLPYTLHRMLLESGIFIVENLTGLSALVGHEPRSYTFMALPLKADTEASLVRAVAVE